MVKEFSCFFQTLIMGNRDDIDEMSAGNASVLTTVLKLIDKYDLYGSVAFPKHHNQADVPEIYRLAAKMKVYCIPRSFIQLWQLTLLNGILWLCSLQGVFINPALVEPFGLTLIEVRFSVLTSKTSPIAFSEGNQN